MRAAGSGGALRGPARFPLADLLLHGAQVTRPHVSREAEEVRARVGLVGQDVGEPAVCFTRVAPPTGGHYVSGRVVAAPGARLHVIDAQRLGGKDLAAVHAAVRVAREDLGPLHRTFAPLDPSFPGPSLSGVAVPNPLDPRRFLLDTAKRLFDDEVMGSSADAPPRLTGQALQSLHTLRMSRSRDKILENLDEMYREAFERAQQSGDASQMTTLDFAYRREQLYFEILLDIRDAMERR